jgi:hypothetical protein
MNNLIVFENVSKFYGEVLGVNRVSLTIPPMARAQSGVSSALCRFGRTLTGFSSPLVTVLKRRATTRPWEC